jgi:hypothetical protein
MKNYRLLWCFVALMIITVVSCKKPPEDVDPEDQLTGFDRIEVENAYIPDLSIFDQYHPFLIDSFLHLIVSSSGSQSHDLAIYDLNGNLQSRKTFYTSGYPLGIWSASYDAERGFIYISGEIDDEGASGYANPLFLVIDLTATLIKEKKYDWPGRDNGISQALHRPGHMPVLLAWDRAGSIGSYATYEHKLIFMDENYDSLIGMKIFLDSSQLKYMDFRDADLIRMVGEKTDSAGIPNYTHFFYAEMNLSGYFTDNRRLDGLNTGHIHIRAQDPMSFYSWAPTGNKSIYWNRYSQDGSLIRTTNYDLFHGPYGWYDYGLTFTMDPHSDKNILFGQFYTGGGYEKPENHGMYIIKCDDEGNDEYRVVFNEDLSGFTTGSNLFPLGPDEFLLLYGFIFNDEGEKLCLTHIKL